MTDTSAAGVTEARRLRGILIASLLIVATGEGVDLVMDRPRQWLSLHVVFELALLSGALIALSILGIGWLRASRSLDEAHRALIQRGDERDAWRASAQNALEGLGRAIDDQFGAWELTAAERDVAIRLLKGHSHKQIAADTGRSERTVRQHGGAVYAKSRLGGRAELAAYFLEDLMLPQRERVARGSVADGQPGSSPPAGQAHRGDDEQ